MRKKNRFSHHLLSLSKMTESNSESKLSQILDLLESAGYGGANNSNLSDFQKIFNGIAWCISSTNHRRKIETVDDIVDALRLMGCPHALQATQIEDFDYACIYPAVQWIVGLLKTQQQESNDENERKDSSAEMQVLKERIEEAGIGSMVQCLVSLLKKSKDLERQETEFKSDYNSIHLRLQSEITKLEEVSTSGNAEKDLQDYFDCSIFDLSNKLKSSKKELSCKLRELVSLKRQLDELPVEAELVQYERRFSELNVHMQDRHRQTRKYYETYNALLEMKDLMLKEISLLNSVDSQFGDAIGKPNGRAKLNDSMEAISKGIGQKLEKVQLGTQVEQKTLETLREQYTAAIMNQRRCSVLLKDFQDECRKNERLKKELVLHEKQTGQFSN